MKPESGSDAAKASAHRRPTSRHTSKLSSVQKSGKATMLARSRVVA
jgi:hypothetical protein